MITNAKVFRPEHPPRDLHHREGQLDHLSSVLDPTRVDRPENVCIFGPSGAGKTTIAKYTLDQLEKEALDLHWAYVNCMADNTPAAVLFEIVRETGLGADIKREGTASSEAIHRLRECDDHIIAVLDEVGSLDEQPLLALWNVPNVSLICITIDEDEWFTALSSKAKSRMQSAETVRMDKYRHTELVDILDSRVVHGLVGSRLDDGVIDYIADLAAGDARYAIALLRQAALHVDRHDMHQLTEPVVDAIADDAASEIRDRNIRSLGSHHRLLLRIIEEADEIDSGTLHARYEDRVQSPKSRPTRRRYLRSLIRSDLVERDGSTQDMRYRSLD
ncbi:Cdc6/Cdc18 family protein [Halomicrobium katesii]|uniref:Cdc6/Cdc18 family protein n=1 Tax=Halomicrobium katesii TaxID=437163 RepID=UPI0003747C5C|nr:Cdc6/Cdc18 family protein [Halomicrobium katesii]